MVMSLSRIFYGHMICLLKFLYYLYLDPIVCLDIIDQMFKYIGNYFLLGALIIPSKVLMVSASALTSKN